MGKKYGFLAIWQHPSGATLRIQQVNSGGPWLPLTDIWGWGDPWGSQAAAAEISTGKVGRDGVRGGNEPRKRQAGEWLLQVRNVGMDHCGTP